MIHTVKIVLNNINQFTMKICEQCELEIPLELGLILFYRHLNGHKLYYHEKCIPVKKEVSNIKKERIEKHKMHSGLDENTINQLEEQSNINLLLMYKNDKELKTGYNRVKLRRLGYLTKSGKMTDKALIILNKEKI